MNKFAVFIFYLYFLFIFYYLIILLLCYFETIYNNLNMIESNNKEVCNENI